MKITPIAANYNAKKNNSPSFGYLHYDEKLFKTALSKKSLKNILDAPLVKEIQDIWQKELNLSPLDNHGTVKGVLNFECDETYEGSAKALRKAFYVSSKDSVEQINTKVSDATEVLKREPLVLTANSTGIKEVLQNLKISLNKFLN